MGNQLKGEPKCPNCSELADGFTELAKDTIPRKGDVVICAYCTSIGMYDMVEDNWVIRVPTDEEMEKLLIMLPELPKQVEMVKRIRAEYLQQNN